MSHPKAAVRAGVGVDKMAKREVFHSSPSKDGGWKVTRPRAPDEDVRFEPAVLVRSHRDHAVCDGRRAGGQKLRLHGVR
jgi:hypothetical protein